MGELTISGKNLGAFAMPDFCPRCAWLKLKMENKLPYQIFPGIFSSIDSYTKKVTNINYDKSGKIPVWLSTFGKAGKPMKVPHYINFSFTDKKTNIKLWGAPDEILQFKDSYSILDYKTAKYTKNADKLMPIYEVQLNAYAYIAEMGRYFTPVKSLGLIYYEPVTDLSHDSIDSVMLDDGFYMEFRNNIHPIKLDDKIVPALLKKVRQLYDINKPPKGNDDCYDCDMLETLFSVLKMK